MTEYDEQIESDVEPEASSEPQEESAQETSREPEETSQEANSGKQTDDAEKPFHEHPRFKELVEQKNRYAEQYRTIEENYKQLAQRLENMQRDIPKAAPQEDALIAELKQIRPEFGKRFEEMYNKIQLIDELQNGNSQLKEQAFISSALSEIKSLHDANKVSDILKARLDREMDMDYRQGKIRNLDDIRSSYKRVHEDYTKWVDDIKRSERGSYVADKKKDASVPRSQPKGKSVNAGKAQEFSKDPAEARQQLIRKVLAGVKAESDL